MTGHTVSSPFSSKCSVRGEELPSNTANAHLPADMIKAGVLKEHTHGPQTYTDYIQTTANLIATTLLKKDAEYGGSWLKRGGIGAYMMKVRKSDRLEEQVKKKGYDVFAAIQASKHTSESLEDTLLDDAGYAILILAEARARGII